MATMTMDFGTPRVRSHPTVQPALRLTARGRMVIRATAALLLAVVGYTVLGLVSGVAVSASDDARTRPAHSVVVRPGETLWQIAARELPSMDPREGIAVIRLRNGLAAGDVLQAGSTIAIPQP